MTAAAKDTTQSQRVQLIPKIAARYNVDADKMMVTLKSTVFKGQKAANGGPPREATNEEMMSLLIVADQYGLNPFTREIYAFPDEKRGGIVPVVSIDGWLRIINERAELQSMGIVYGDFGPPVEGVEPDAYVEVTIKRSDRTMPIVVREYMRECWRDTGPWKSHPRRMLRHKAMIQAGRVAFGFGGIFDPDEAERIRDAAIERSVVSTQKPATVAPKEKAAPAAAAKPAALQKLPKDELLAALDETGISEQTVCEKFEVDHIDSLGDEGCRLAANWARNVNAPAG